MTGREPAFLGKKESLEECWEKNRKEAWLQTLGIMSIHHFMSGRIRKCSLLGGSLSPFLTPFYLSIVFLEKRIVLSIHFAVSWTFHEDVCRKLFIFPFLEGLFHSILLSSSILLDQNSISLLSCQVEQDQYVSLSSFLCLFLLTTTKRHESQNVYFDTGSPNAIRLREEFVTLIQL